MSRHNNPVILSYHESLLRLSDIELLRGPCWLNDTVISFYFEYLEKRRFKNDSFLLFVPPQVTQCIKIAPSNEIDVFLNPLLAHPKRFIFFALNDNEQTDVSGGSHWSLLAFSNPERMIFHFDSSKGTNQEQAMEFGEKLLKYFGLHSFGCFTEPVCLQQTNGYDCGIHVLCNVENIADYASKHHRMEGCPVLDRETVGSGLSCLMKEHWSWLFSLMVSDVWSFHFNTVTSSGVLLDNFEVFFLPELYENYPVCFTKKVPKLLYHIGLILEVPQPESISSKFIVEGIPVVILLINMNPQFFFGRRLSPSKDVSK